MGGGCMVVQYPNYSVQETMGEGGVLQKFKWEGPEGVIHYLSPVTISQLVKCYPVNCKHSYQGNVFIRKVYKGPSASRM